jgi:hypothetical protein
MDRYWEANPVTVVPPTPPQASGGYPTDGNPVTATPPTTPGAWWYHSITEEIRNAIVALGSKPDFTEVDQLGSAIMAAIAKAINGATAQLAKVAYTGSYPDLINRPNLATVATSGNYNDLTNKPDLSVYATNATVNADVANLQGEINTTNAALGPAQQLTAVGRFTSNWSEVVPGTRNAAYSAIQNSGDNSNPSSNTLSLQAYVNGIAVANQIDNNPTGGKICSVSWIAPPGSTVSVSSAPYNGGTGTFSVTRLQ